MKVGMVTNSYLIIQLTYKGPDAIDTRWIISICWPYVKAGICLLWDCRQSTQLVPILQEQNVVVAATEVQLKDINCSDKSDNQICLNWKQIIGQSTPTSSIAS